MRPLTPRERRVLALGLLVMALGLAWLLVVGPIVGGFAGRAAERRELQQAWLRNGRIIGSLPVFRAAAEAQDRSAPRFAVFAPSQTAAVAALKDRVQKIAADEAFAVRGLEDATAADQPGMVKVRADLTLTLVQFSDLVKSLQTGDPYVAVDFVSVAADRSFAAGRLEPLDVRLELATLWRARRGRP